MDNKIRVILVEDEPDLCDSLVEFLELSDIETTGVNSGIEFYRSMAQNRYTIAVLDVGLPDQSGYLLAEYIHKNFAMGIIILTARGEADERLKGYEAGADIYMVKPIDSRELVTAIKNLSHRLQTGRRRQSEDSDSRSWLLDNHSWNLLSPNNERIHLTAKEFMFISILAAHAGEMVRREHLLGEMGYSDDEYANRAMDSLVRRLRRKIETGTGCPSPIKTAYTGGYCFAAPICSS